MVLIDIGKIVKEAKKKDSNVDEGKLVAKIMYDVMMQKNTYKGKALGESEVPKGLKEAVEEYFATHRHKDWSQAPFKLARLERSNVNEAVIYAVPKSIYNENLREMFGDDLKFEKGLSKVGKKFGVPIQLPWYCYAK